VGHAGVVLTHPDSGMSGRFRVLSPDFPPHRHRHVTAAHMTKHMSGTQRYPCAVCGDPWTLDAPDYVELIVNAPDGGGTQWLGAHASCLNRFLDIKVEVGIE
jgi:hypothetical protein